MCVCSFFQFQAYDIVIFSEGWVGGTDCIYSVGSDSQLVFKDSPATTIVLFNFPTILRCSASEPNPPANIIWLKDEVISTTDPRGRFTVTYDSTTGSSEYSINTVSYQDNRNYQCVAVDAAGNILANSAVGQLTVQGTN